MRDWKDIDLRKLEDAELSDNRFEYDRDSNEKHIQVVLEKPVILQLFYIRRADLPRSSNSKDDSNRFYEMSVTDGRNRFTAVFLDEEPTANKTKKGSKGNKTGLSVKSCPGSKIEVSGIVEVWSGVLYLNSQNTKFIGGKVDDLIQESDEKKKTQRHQLFN